jgi:RimJ/RimL family protein N-acetyltransferase
MTIVGYGITLVRLGAEHIEMVRQWRNDEHINRFMDYREHISEEAQQRWFSSLDPARDFYFLIGHGNTFHGLIHFSSIDWDRNVGQSGLFIRTAAFQGTHLPVCASALMLEYFFGNTPLQAVEAKVMHGNDVALRYNLGLGFREITSEHPERFRRLRLDKSDFEEVFGAKLQLLKRIHGADVNVRSR